MRKSTDFGGDFGSREVATTLLYKKTNTNLKTPPLWQSKRLLVMTLLFLGSSMHSMLCYVVNIAIIDMTTPKSLDQFNNSTSTIPAEFQWDSMTVGVILNMYFYGALFSPIGGVLAQKYGGSVMLGVSIGLSGIVTLLAPSALRRNFYLFLLTRGLVGVFEGFSATTFMEILSNWIPRKERSIFMSILMNGFYTGIAVTYPFCGYVVHQRGWSMAFYATGILSIMWSSLWLSVVTNEPSKDKWISKGEMLYITERTFTSGPSNKDQPYREILKSPPFWAVCLSKFVYGWGATFIVGYFPQYIKDRTHNDVEKIGLISSIPQFFNIAINPIAGIMIGFWENHSRLGITQIHKTIISGGLMLCSVLFVVISLVDDFIVSIICFMIIIGLLSSNKIVLGLISINMAPNHVSLIGGISIFWQTFGFIFSQTFIGFMVKNHKLEEWNTCYMISTGVMVLGAVTFAFCGSSEPQKWSLGQGQSTKDIKIIPLRNIISK